MAAIARCCLCRVFKDQSHYKTLIHYMTIPEDAKCNECMYDFDRLVDVDVTVGRIYGQFVFAENRYVWTSISPIMLEMYYERQKERGVRPL